MEAHEHPGTPITPIQLSVRVRHPGIDPHEISTALGLTPEHCFKAGEARSSRATGHEAGQHTETYWLAALPNEPWPDPIEPTFLAAIAASRPDRKVVLSTEAWRAASRHFGARNIEIILLYCLRRLSARQEFLTRLQSEGGDIALILLMDRQSTADFALPVALARLLVQLGIDLEFKFA